jgi:hypothetical protein
MTAQTPKLFELLTSREQLPTANLTNEEHITQLESCWEYLFNVTQQNRLFWRNYQGILRPMAFAVMHRFAYDELIAVTNAHVHWGDRSFEMRTFFDQALQQVQPEIKKLRQANKEAGPGDDTYVSKFMLVDDFRDSWRCIADSEGLSFGEEYAAFSGALEGYINADRSADQLFEVLTPWLNTRYAYGGLRLLNLHLGPMVYDDQDYDNSTGAAYAQFTATVSARVSRDRLVTAYGEFLLYEVTVESPAILQAFVPYARGTDTAVVVTGTRPSPVETGATIVSFECPLDFADLTELLGEFVAEPGITGIRVSTLQAL